MLDGEGSFALVMGIISGYPVGAKIAASFRNDNVCSKEECERLLSFTNNSGPLFIIGTVGITMYNSINIGIILFVAHLLASLCVGFIFRFWKYNKDSNNFKTLAKHNFTNNNISIKNLGEVISQSISSSISTIFMIGGFIILFSCLISILNASGLVNIVAQTLTPLFKTLNIDTSFINGIFTGFFEITNGINLISSVYSSNFINVVITAFLLGFGGISVMLQVLSIISKTDLSPKPYIFGKILHGILASVFTLIFLKLQFLLNFSL